MPQSGSIYRVLIASPGDCEEERKIVPELLYAWNAAHSLQSGAILEPVLWETHSTPELGDRPQGIINRQLVEYCDILIGVFWTRLGTDTGKAKSGTAEEIQQFYDSGRRVLLYFSARPASLDRVDHRQYTALTKYRDQMRKAGIVSSYRDVPEFRDLVRQHIANAMAELLSHLSDVRSAAIQTDRETIESNSRMPLQSVIRAFEVEWGSERDSNPSTLEPAKDILRVAQQNLVRYLAEAGSDAESEVGRTVQSAIKHIRALSRRVLRPDAGRSFHAFWDEGDRIVSELRDLAPNN
jgi:hypothetical protein